MTDIIAYGVLGIAAMVIMSPIILGIYIIWKMPK